MKQIFFLFATLIISSTAYGWGQKGHDTVAYIAECNLTPEAYKKVTASLGGHSLVYFANWMDNASHTPAYAYTKTWHYVNIDEGDTYETSEKNEDGDVLVAINSIVDKLKSHTLAPEEENINLRMLIHLVGDMHAPLHCGHKSDLGGNRIYVKHFNSDKKLHSIWDSALVEAAHKWSYTEWQQQIDKFCSDELRAKYTRGTPRDWLEETFQSCADIYHNTPSGTNISYDYIAHYAPLIESRLLAGGIRLATLLNEIYK